jgi:hypothetical protein
VSGFIEFQRFTDDEALQETLAALEAAGIPCRTGSTSPGTETSWTGTGYISQIILSVPASRHPEARAILEARYVGIPLPADHHLHSASDDDLIEILSHETEWDPYDVAHARRIARARNIDQDFIQHIASQRLAHLREGKQASRLLVIGGVLLAIFGAWGMPLLSAMALGIGWSLAAMKENRPEGRFPTYDAPSRRTGKGICIFAALTFIIAILRWWQQLH